MSKASAQNLVQVGTPKRDELVTATSSAKIALEDASYQHGLLTKDFDAIKERFDASAANLATKKATFEEIDAQRTAYAGAVNSAEQSAKLYEASEALMADGSAANDALAESILVQAQQLETLATQVIAPGAPPPAPLPMP